MIILTVIGLAISTFVLLTIKSHLSANQGLLMMIVAAVINIVFPNPVTQVFLITYLVIFVLKLIAKLVALCLLKRAYNKTKETHSNA